MKRVLEVRRGGERVGVLTFTKTGDASLRYTTAFLGQREAGRPGLSCSLPVSSAASSATAWCRGLLPEGEALRLLAADLRVSMFDTHALLERHGRDVAGAFEIVDRSGGSHREAGLAAYSSASLIDHVAEVATGEHPLGVQDDSELSLAGVQNKLLLVETEAGWARPVHGYPSTHLLKTDHAVHRGVVNAEHAALAFARQIGLPAVESEVVTLGDVRCIIVKRFDRTQRVGAVDRLHQEDLLQALGLDPTTRGGRMKYQRVGAEPPSLWHLADLLKRFGNQEELIVLLTFVVFNALIGNGDAHAKNFSLMIQDDGTVRLAPLYDTVPTLLWPSLKDRNALWVGNEPTLSRTTGASLTREAMRWGIHGSLAEEVVRTVVRAARLGLESIEHQGLRDLVRANSERIGSSLCNVLGLHICRTDV